MANSNNGFAKNGLKFKHNLCWHTFPEDPDGELYTDLPNRSEIMKIDKDKYFEFLKQFEKKE